ncbi:ABC transporter permease [Clostridium botulinum]|uniref:ABC transporter permease n=3 Tax=Clostridium botulinum TaxID=1491 RepID=A0A0A2HAM6_CLOBO|nr:ABC transporter permease [Clostridium botulinum]ACO85254.1 peptide/opine/nickel uptake ABC transporter, PepT family, permease protein [Clostridium botulinum A2 str. Kyoto]APC80111.1 binding--dependent transport system inner membrane component family protein [Clostridium botulinum]APC84625.1 binding--dependent transport system inner membrane component family protein [Clostridium botulinum]APH20085.1 binding--dependent transport system inner membrane component family protein [Clostridium botul
MKKYCKIFKKCSIIGKLSLLVAFVFIIVAILCPLLCKHPYNVPSGGALNSPSMEHILGTDDLGIDLWSQICYGGRISITLGVSIALLAGTFGSFVGIISGYYGGIIDKFLMRFTDLVLVLPQLPIMIVLAAFLGPKLKNVIIVLSIFSWIEPSRVIRSKVMSIKDENYIKAAKSYGASFFHIFSKHILPQIFPLVSISMVKIISKAIIAESSLSFLGLGDPVSKSWGMILNHAIDFDGIYFTDYWKWWITAPLLSIIILVLSFAFIGKEIESF